MTKDEKMKMAKILKRNQEFTEIRHQELEEIKKPLLRARKRIKEIYAKYGKMAKQPSEVVEKSEMQISQYTKTEVKSELSSIAHSTFQTAQASSDKSGLKSLLNSSYLGNQDIVQEDPSSTSSEKPSIQSTIQLSAKSSKHEEPASETSYDHGSHAASSSKVSKHQSGSAGTTAKKDEIFLHDGKVAYKQQLDEEGEFNFSDDEGFYDEEEDYIVKKLDLIQGVEEESGNTGAAEEATTAKQYSAISSVGGQVEDGDDQDNAKKRRASMSDFVGSNGEDGGGAGQQSAEEAGESESSSSE